MKSGLDGPAQFPLLDHPGQGLLYLEETAFHLFRSLLIGPNPFLEILPSLLKVGEPVLERGRLGQRIDQSPLLLLQLAQQGVIPASKIIEARFHLSKLGALLSPFLLQALSVLLRSSPFSLSPSPGAKPVSHLFDELGLLPLKSFAFSSEKFDLAFYLLNPSPESRKPPVERSGSFSSSSIPFSLIVSIEASRSAV